MFQYEKTKEKPELDPVSDMAFCFIRSQMERDQQAYDEKCERNSQNGAKGGRPRKSEKSERFSEKRTVFLESEKSQKSQGEGEGEGKGKGEGKEYIKKDTLYREGSRHSREKTLRSGVVYKHKTKDLLHEPTKAVSRSVFCFERVCFIIRCFAVYFVFLLTDGKRHAKHINSLIWPNFGVFLSILG